MKKCIITLRKGRRVIKVRLRNPPDAPPVVEAVKPVPAAAVPAAVVSTEKKNPRKAKTKLVYVIQTNHGYGWDDDTEENTWKEAREQLRTYRENSYGRFATRCIKRRVPNTNPRRRRR